MIEIRFKPIPHIIPITVEMEYNTRGIFILAFDTGASFITIKPDVAESLGYDVGKLPISGTVLTASGEETVRNAVLKSVMLQDIKIQNVEVAVMPLPEALNIDGLLGLNFLRHFKVTLDVSEGLLQFERK